jgi:hypothetical protein
MRDVRPAFWPESLSGTALMIAWHPVRGKPCEKGQHRQGAASFTARSPPRHVMLGAATGEIDSIGVMLRHCTGTKHLGRRPTGARTRARCFGCASA